MRIELEYVEIRNFFCFGNKWQKVEFAKGINLITGFDSNNSKSNGSGKSSFIESIIFGLFGETTKDLNKNQIINWKNKKECEVKICFKRGDDVYVIHRGLKPNFIIVYKNDKALDQLSSVVDMQKYIESSLLEIDYDTFVSIIHYNPTTSKSIFNVQKAQKRSFIEKIFGLEMYSEISDKCNKEISQLNVSLLESEKILELKNRDITPLKEQTISLQQNIIKDKKEYKENLNKINEKKNVIKINDEELLTFKNKLEIIIQKKENYKITITDLNKRKEIIVEKVKMIDGKDNGFNIEEYENTNEKINSLELKYIKDVDHLTDKIEEILKVNDDIKNEISKYKLEITMLKTEFSNLIKLESGICPLCENEIDKEDLNVKKDETEKFILDKENLIVGLNIKINENKENINEIKTDININSKIKDNLDVLKSIFMKLTYEKKEYDLYMLNKSLILEMTEEVDNIINKVNSEKVELEKLEKLEKVVVIKIDEIEKNKSIFNELEKEIEIQNKLLEEKEKKYREIEEIIKSNKDKLIEIRKTIELENKKKLEFKEKIEYYDYIKKICKDENVKQYAISNMIPFLSKQVNNYLSEVGFNFYLKFDNWLNVEIKGPGIRDAGFGNLSSGQQKTTNLAMILSFLDISKLQVSSFPDILLLDEILDGAIDSITLTQMFNIIAKKQKEDNLKLFIVSHRKEINEIGKLDNIYKIEMKDGFSKITKTTAL